MLQSFLQQDLLNQHGRSARDGGYGGGGGGCGGFEVFAFLAFLLALLDLIMDLNNMDMTGTGGRNLEKRDLPSQSEFCEDDLDFKEGLWAVGQLADAALKATSSAPPCDRYHLCQAAMKISQKGPLSAAFTYLAGEWFENWPELEGAGFGQIVKEASKTLSCSFYNDSSLCNSTKIPDDDNLPTEERLRTKMKEIIRDYVIAKT